MVSKQTAKRILVINLHSSQNAGDATLLEMTVRNLRSIFSEAQIVLAMNDPDHDVHDFDNVEVVGSFAAHFNPCQLDRQVRWQIGMMIWGIAISLAAASWYRIFNRSPRWLPAMLRKLLLAYMDSDFIVSCPGNIFATTGRFGMPFLISAFTVAYGLILDKPLYVMPQSIGPLKHRWERTLVRLLYSNARLVFIREPVSFRLAGEIGIRATRLRLIPDLAFAFPQDSLEKASDILKKHGVNREGPRAGVTVINRLIRHVSNEEWDQFERSVARALSSFISKYGGSVVFFPQVIGPTEKEDDRIAARRIIAQMTQADHAFLIDEQVSPATLKAMYGLMDIFVATRMHSAIFATSMGVPSLLIEYLHKIRGLAEMLELEEWLLELTEVNEDNLWEMLDALWQSRLTVQRHLQCLVPNLAEQASQAMEIMAGELYGG